MRNILLSYFEFGPAVQEEKSFQDIFIYSSGIFFVKYFQTICAIMIVGSMPNVSVK